MPETPRRSSLLIAFFWIGLWSGPSSDGADTTRVITKNAPHPIVAGFERFLDEPRVGPVRGGELLLGELNCTSCHRAGPNQEALLIRKAAPVLDDVGNRVRPSYLRAFLTDPHATKPGTTMPHLLGGLDEPRKHEVVEALVHFLATTGRLVEKNPIAKVAEAGQTLYQRIGCLACHDPREKETPGLATSVPLGDLASKYSIPSLAVFLQDPIRARPSGRMPGMSLSEEDATRIASYLLKGFKIDDHPNLKYAYYEGQWQNLPNFADLRAVATGQSTGFDLGVAKQDQVFGLVFKGYLRIDREGDYQFFLSSDDGSRLTIDDKAVVENGGIHPAQEKAGSVRLARGMHRIVVEYFDSGGNSSLDVSYEGPALGRQPLGPSLSLTKEGPRPVKGEAIFSPDPVLAAKGRDLFATIGCASCHSFRQDGKLIESKVSARPLAQLGTSGGCLATDPAAGLPRYGLSESQQKAIGSAIKVLANPPDRPPSTPEVISRTMAAFNCYACHRRADFGGVEPARDASFETTQKEMGDEGRIPPTLDGVGGKLNDAYLKAVLDQGAKDRPYMLTRMPRFGAGSVGHLAAAFEELDTIAPVGPVLIDLPARRVKVSGRFIVGGQALNCVACHTFKGEEAHGIQAIDMTTMTQRLRRDWFHRYLPDPQAFRPGTRMPSGWPMGQSLLPDLLGGDAQKQIEAVWLYLSDGREAAAPYGLGREPIPLVPGKEAILYRNFIDGAGPRAIGVGYPEHGNLAFDANDPRIVLIWQGAFIDASRHWVDRGSGFQPPLGDNVIHLPAGPAFATLTDPAGAWPSQSSPALAPKFRGYHLDAARKPTFLYDLGPIHVEDFPDVLPGKERDDVSIRRTLTLSANGPVADVWFRAGVADKIEPIADGWFTLGGDLKMRLRSPSTPVIRSSQGKAELLLPVKLSDGKVAIEQEIRW